MVKTWSAKLTTPLLLRVRSDVVARARRGRLDGPAVFGLDQVEHDRRVAVGFPVSELPVAHDAEERRGDFPVVLVAHVAVGGVGALGPAEDADRVAVGHDALDADA